MKHNRIVLSAALALISLPVLLACEGDMTAPEESGRVTADAPAAKLSVVPSSVQIEKGESYWLTAQIEDVEGRRIEGEQAVHWTSSNANIVRVSGSASRVMVTGVSSGTVVITARYAGLASTARIRVAPTGFQPEPDDDGDTERER